MSNQFLTSVVYLLKPFLEKKLDERKGELSRKLTLSQSLNPNIISIIQNNQNSLEPKNFSVFYFLFHFFFLF